MSLSFFTSEFCRRLKVLDQIFKEVFCNKKTIKIDYSSVLRSHIDAYEKKDTHDKLPKSPVMLKDPCDSHAQITMYDMFGNTNVYVVLCVSKTNSCIT